MNKLDENQQKDFDANVTAAPCAFTPQELVQCGACSRANAPMRVSCLYCGAALELTQRNIQAESAPATPESEAEKAFHVVVTSAGPIAPGEDALTGAAELLRLTPAWLSSMLSSALGAPVYSANTEQDANEICESLSKLGIRSAVVSDDELSSSRELPRLRGLTLTEELLEGFGLHGDKKLSTVWDDIVLMVAGRIHLKQIELEQKRQRDQSKLVDEREMTSDEAVLDIYVRGERSGWRIAADHFDFSCLGGEKAMVAFRNFFLLIDRLRERATNAVFDDSYVRLRNPLDVVWPCDEKTGQTTQRRAIGASVEATRISNSNEGQFTRYSRLLHFLSASDRKQL